MAISKKEAKTGGKKTQQAAPAASDGKLSRAKRKKLAKLRKKALQRSWCWYCDREFEDAKVLLSHQKAKHFRCPHCPRRLNTAGGLAVHIDQVHKLGTDRIANAVPGRDTFDVEIYGMEGIPAHDLKEWKRKKAVEAGMDPVTGQTKSGSNKQKINKAVISLEELKRQLGVHKDLMEGKITPSQAAQLMAGKDAPQPSGAPAAPTLPPMGMPGMAPPPGSKLSKIFDELAESDFNGLSVPAPPSGMPMPPPGMPLPPPGMPLPPGMSTAPAAPGSGPATGMPAPPGIPQPPSAAQAAAPSATPAPPAVPTAPVPFKIKDGQMLVFGNPNDVSPEERRARQERYAVKDDPATGRPRAVDLI